MPSLPDCHHCQFRDRPEPCVALATGHARFCETTDPQNLAYKPSMVKAVEQNTLQLAGTWVAPIRVVKPDKPARSERLNAWYAVRDLIEACDYRGTKVSTGCQCLHVCFAGKGDKAFEADWHSVDTHDCKECVTSKAL